LVEMSVLEDEWRSRQATPAALATAEVGISA
jgi:hypothetical protein